VKLVKSHYLHQISDDSRERNFVYHTLFGNPRIFNKDGLIFLNLFENERNIGEIKKLTNGNPTELISDLTKIYFLVPSGFDEREILRQKKLEHLKNVEQRRTINHISLSISNLCNFGCDHCMFFQCSNKKRRQQHFDYSSKMMKWEMAKRCIDSYKAIMRENEEKHGRIHFGNAEPLLNWPIIKKTLEYCESSSEFSFEYGINTNLSLLTKDIADVFKKYRVRIATSLDGLEKANDAIRVTKDGKGTFQRLIKKFDLLEKIDYPLDSISITVTSKNFYLIDNEIVNFAADRNMTSIAFDYDLIDIFDIPLDKKVNKLMQLKSHAESKKIFFGGTWSSPFRKLMSISLLEKTYAFCAAAEGLGLTFNPDGFIKACDYSTETIGHIDYLENLFQESEGLYRFVKNHLPGFINSCKGCIIEGQCAGQCHITREVSNRSAKKDLVEKMCDFYKTITEKLINNSLINE
jgi:radical SAM protein with 4Fe4S-binding SPASM domain